MIFTYIQNEIGKKYKLRKKRYLYITDYDSDKKFEEDENIIGFITLKALKKEKDVSSDDLVQELLKDEDKHPLNVFSFGEKQYLIEKKEDIGKKHIKGYVSVKEDTKGNSDVKYFAVTSRFILPLWLLIFANFWNGCMTVIAATLVGLVLLNSGNKTQDVQTTDNNANTAIKIADNVEKYDDTPIDIDSASSEEIPENDAGDIDLNLYSYQSLSVGDVLNLTNISTNDVYLKYIITDATTNEEIYSTDLISYGTDIPWIPSDYLSVGTHDVIFNIVPYTLDYELCVPYTMPVTIVIQ